MAVALLSLGAVILVPQAHARSVTLAWDANPEPDIAGYRVSYGTQSATYTETIDVGNVLTATIPNLGAGITYYFVLTAYNTANLESAPSAEVVSNPDPPNQLPSVNLTSPASGSPFTAPAAIALSASATDSDGNITKVEFYQGLTKIGEDTTAPYTYTWSGAAPGTYSLSARGFDDSGDWSTSTAVTITVIEAPPASGGGQILLEAESATLTAPMTIGTDPQASGGSYVYAPTAGGGGTVTLDITAPITADYYVWCRVLAPDSSRESFFVTMDSGNEKTFKAGAPYSSQWRWSRINRKSGEARAYFLTAGVHTITFRVRDADTGLDRVIISSDPLFVPSDSDTGVADSVAIATQPQSQIFVPGNTVSFNVSTTASGAVNYQWKKNGTDIPGANDFSFMIPAAQTQDAGIYSVMATSGSASATSLAATLAIASRSVTLDWDANPEPDIAGYRLSYGVQSVTYTETIDAGNALTATVPDLVVGITYYFVVTAYNT
ncbi:MAG: Ig-like domain-containing protein, partial [Verrucomicrobiales bacterium]